MDFYRIEEKKQEFIEIRNINGRETKCSWKRRQNYDISKRA